MEYFISDHLGSTGITTDTSGAKVSEMRYKPWGEVRYSWTSSQTTTPTYKLPSYTYTGQYSYMDDPTTTGVTEGFGLMFYNARWYDPALGRFAQANTIVPGGVQGLDRYAYVNNSPVRFTDPTGHKCVPVEECNGSSGSSSSSNITMGGQCSIIPGFVCTGPKPQAGDPIYVHPPASADQLTKNGKIIMDYYIYLKTWFYHTLTLEQFLGLMLMYEINGLDVAQEWVVNSAIDQLFAKNHGTDRANPYCPNGGACYAGVFNYLGAYSESAIGHAISHNNLLPPHLANNSNDDLFIEAASIGELIMTNRDNHPMFQGIHYGNTWTKPWITKARNNLNIVDSAFVGNGLLALKGTFVAYSVTQENYWMCVTENGYGGC